MWQWKDNTIFYFENKKLNYLKIKIQIYCNLIKILIVQNVHEVYANKIHAWKKNVRRVRMGKRISLLGSRRCFITNVKSNQDGFV